MKVLGLAADKGGSLFYRMDEPARAARESGVDISIVHDIDVKAGQDQNGLVYVAEVFTDADVMVIQRPLKQSMLAVIQQARKQGIAIVIEIDDDFHTVSPSNIAYNAVAPDKNFLHNYKWLESCLALADVVTVSTSRLQKYGLKSPGGAVVVSNYLPRYVDRIKPSEGSRDPSVPLRVGWTGSVATHPHDLQRMGSFFRDTGTPFHVVGDSRGIDTVIQSSNVIHSPWMASVPEYWQAIVDLIDIGLVPLEITAFNQAKCLDIDTPINTRTGVKAIGSLCEGDLILSRGAWRKVEAVSHETATVGREVRLTSGHSLKLTEDHRLMTAAGDWKTASQVEVGESLALQPEMQPDDLPYVRVPWPPDGRIRDADLEQWFTRATSGPTVTIDETWGEFLGLFMGDGSVGAKGVVNIHCDGQDQDLIERIRSMWDRVGLTARIKTDKRSPRRVTVVVQSVFLQRFLESLGLVSHPTVNGTARKGGKRIVAVPDVIWRSPASVLAAYASGVYEADGHVTSTGACLTLKQRPAIEQVQHLLGLLGIWSTIHPKTIKSGRYAGNTYAQLVIPAAGRERFSEVAGFLSERKRARLASVITKTPYRGNRANSGVPWQSLVESNNPTWLVPVDIQVEGEQFSAAGFVSHNSSLKGREFAALGIPFIASPTDEYERLFAYGAGLQANSPGVWARYIPQLMQGDRLYRRVRDEGLRVAADLVLEDHVDEWIGAWETALRISDTRKRVVSV